jgi:hypothetical protein
MPLLSCFPILVHRKSGFDVLEHARVLQRTGSIRQIPFALICASLRAALEYAQSVAAEARLLDLSQYKHKPEQIVTGTIRNFGFGLGGVLKLCEEGSRKFIRESILTTSCRGAMPQCPRWSLKKLD